MNVFSTIVADPPWPYDSARAMPVKQELTHYAYGGNVSSQERYGAMSIAELRGLPVKHHVTKNAHLYLWTTNSFMVEAHELARAWGFIPKTILTWVKVKKDGSPSMKTGYYFRGATEHVVFAVRGSQPLLIKEGIATAFLSERLPHSVKPDSFFGLVEKASPGPYLEMFARRPRKGWTVWGNQVETDFELCR